MKLAGKIVACAALAAGIAGAAQAADTKDRPNILLIIADDMGFSDLGCYGSEIKTPNLDRLAAEGERFTQFYNCARCWPTRSSLMTGYYAPQTGADPNLGHGHYVKWTTPVPKMLKPLGYRTYHAGKWHVQATDCNSAHDAGFDHAYDEAQGYRYFTPFYHALDGKMLPQPKPEDGYFMDKAIGNYMIDFLGEHFAEHSDQPFFAYMSFLGPHYPLKAPREFIDPYDGVYDEGWDAMRKHRYEKLMALGFPSNWKLSEPEPNVISVHSPQTDEARKVQNEKLGFEDVYQYVPWDTLSDKQKKEQADKMEIHAAMVAHLDYQVGRVLELLGKNGQLDNTLVLFLSDNGADCTQLLQDVQLPDQLKYKIDKTAPWGSEFTCLALGPAWANACNTPFRRHKIWTHEGGISTPLIAHWPKGITQKPGGFIQTRGHVIDFMPTFLDLAGGAIKPASPDAPPFPGKSLVPTFQGLDVPRDFIYFKHVGNRALIKGKWKITSSEMDGNEWELYNIEEDRTEMHNLRASHPEVLSELVRFWTDLDNQYKKQGGYPE
ncbi:MAG: arylsulfatase [Kiritimatiellales bacterium]|nr:arylsulfatase [Kiritimatiellales bacterium]